MSKFIAQFFTDLLETLVTSKTRIKILLKFFLKGNSSSYLRSLAAEFGESSNAIRVELNRFEKAGLLLSYTDGNRKYFHANLSHPLYNDLHNIVLKYSELDQIKDKIVSKLNYRDKVFLTSDFTDGRDSGIIDLIFVGDNLNSSFLMKLVGNAEESISRKIRYIELTREEYGEYKENVKNSKLVLWALDKK